MFKQNQIIDNLTLIKYIKGSKWLCRCTCGKTRIRSYHYLMNYNKITIPLSCGCIKYNKSGKNNPNYKHGKTLTDMKIYWVWDAINQRCNNPKNAAYTRYGAKGITMDKSWKNSIQTFIDDMGPKPNNTERFTVERRNNDKGYNKNNCYWATYTEQNNNRSDSIKILYKGNIITMQKLSKILNINLSTLYARHLRGQDLYAKLRFS